MFAIQLAVALGALAAIGAPTGQGGTPSAPLRTQATAGPAVTADESSRQAEQARRPFDGIFAAPHKFQPRIDLSLGWTTPAGRATPDRPAVVCGTVILAPEPNLDLTMPVARPDPGVTHFIRKVVPRLCRE